MELLRTVAIAVTMLVLALSPTIGEFFTPARYPDTPTSDTNGLELQNNATEEKITSSLPLPAPSLSSQPQQQEQQPQQAYLGQTEQKQQYPQQRQPGGFQQQVPQYPQQQKPTQYPQKQQPTQYPSQRLPQNSPPQQQTQYPSQPQQPEILQQQPNPQTPNLDIAHSANQTESDNSTTTATATAPAAAVSSSTHVPNTSATTSPEEPKTGMDQKNGEADSLIDYALGLAGYKGNNQDKGNDIDGKEEDETPATDSAGGDISDCKVPATLQSCGMPDDAKSYFSLDVSVHGVLKSIFKPETARRLSEQCKPGSWCLPYEDHLDIMDGMDKFYLGSPLCSVAMWSCLERIKAVRQVCQDKELEFLISSVQTLCDLSEFGLNEKGCYTRTVEALYATYVKLFPPVDTVPAETSDNFCESYTAKMTKTYLCADDACSYDQMVVLERFQPWAELVRNATSMYIYCNMTKTCQYEQEEIIEELEQELEEDYGDYAYNYFDNEDEEDEEEEGEGEEEDEEEEEEEEEEPPQMEAEVPIDMLGNTPIGESSSEQAGDVESDESIAAKEKSNIILGLVVMSTMAGVVVLMLAVVVYKRYQSAQIGNMRGYSKLTEEESRMLHNEYS